MTRIPDPRHYAEGLRVDRLAALASRSIHADAAAQVLLRDEINACVEQGRDEMLADALRAAPSRGAYRALWDEMCHAADGGFGAPGALRTQVFAVPIVLVAGARTAVTVPGILPDGAEIERLLDAHGALGATRNFGLSNALCTSEALERIGPGAVRRWSSGWAAGAVSADAIQPAEIHVRPGREQAHLRFLVGAGLTAHDAPHLAPPPDAIGAWGIALTRVLARQLAQPGLSLLPLPRPPAPLLRAVHAGRSAQLQVAFDLFTSNALRDFRASIGEPTVVVYACRSHAGGAEVRVSMSSVLDDTQIEGFCWPLHPLDDVDAVVAGIVQLLHECRVDDVRLLPVVVEAGATGTDRFVTVRDCAAHEHGVALS